MAAEGVKKRASRICQCGAPKAYSSRQCAPCALERRATLLTPETRFWRRVDKSNESGCWLWLGGMRDAKLLYGCFYFQGRARGAHVVSWAMANGRLPDKGEHILHACDNPQCVNPAHLSVGSAADNMHDMFNKGRGAHGVRNGHAKLNDATVRAAREMHAWGYNRRYIANALNAPMPALGHAMKPRESKGATWKHVA